VLYFPLFSKEGKSPLMTPPKGSKVVKAKAKPRSKVLKKKAGTSVGPRENKPAGQIPKKQGSGEVGYKKPPKHSQFKPGQSGNPKGPPKARVTIWRHVCIFSELTEAELKKLKRRGLTMSQRAALKIVEAMARGDFHPGTHLAKYVIDRSEGKIPEQLNITRTEELSDAECDQVRELLKARNG
jgi:hypothetical protein